MTGYKPGQTYRDRENDYWRVDENGNLRLVHEHDGTLSSISHTTSEVEHDFGPLELYSVTFPMFSEEKLADWELEQLKGDPVSHPSHYTSHPSGVECIRITEHMNFCLGNAVKYIWRAGLKSEDAIQDLQKAAFYIDREVKRLEASSGHQ